MRVESKRSEVPGSGFPHPQSAVSRRFSALRDWYSRPFDYEWMSSHPRVQPLVRAMKLVIAAAVLDFGIVALIALLTPMGPVNTLGKVWLYIVIPVQVVVAILWVVRPFPGRLGLVAFGIYGDVGLATTLTTFSDRSDALVGCILFVITGAFFTFFMSPRWLVVHLIFASTIILTISYLGYSEHIRDTGTVLAGANVVLSAVAGIPLFIQLAWNALTTEAIESNRDPLTRLLNRRGLDIALRSIWAQANRTKDGIGIIVVDIDHFKTINDTHGHHIGDVVITQVGMILSESISNAGVVGRTGGEEYLGAFTADDHGLHEILAAIGTALNDNQHRLPVPVTISIGAAMLYSDATSWSPRDVLIRRASEVADRNMYDAKARGGNSITSTSA